MIIVNLLRWFVVLFVVIVIVRIRWVMKFEGYEGILCRGFGRFGNGSKDCGKCY